MCAKSWRRSAAVSKKLECKGIGVNVLAHFVQLASKNAGGNFKGSGSGDSNSNDSDANDEKARIAHLPSSPRAATAGVNSDTNPRNNLRKVVGARKS